MAIDIDKLLRDSSPDVQVPSGVGAAMGATARSVVGTGHTRARGRGFRRTLALTTTGVAALAIGGLVIANNTSAFDSQMPSANSASPTVVGADELTLVAEKLAPADLPLPDGVTLDDAKAAVIDALKANPSLQDKGIYYLDRGVVTKGDWRTTLNQAGPGDNLTSTVKDENFTLTEQIGVSAAYVFYAQCQWERTMIGGQVTPDAGFAALDSLGDPQAFVADDQGVHRVEHEGIGISPSDMATVKRDFNTNCTGALGDAPEAAE